MSFVPINQVTALTMSTIGTATDEDRLLFRQWCAEGFRDIGSQRDWIKVCQLENKEGSFRKPEEMASVIDIALYDDNDNEIWFQYMPDTGGQIHNNRFAVNDVVIQEQVCNTVYLSEDAWYFNLSSGSDHVTKAKIRYFAIPTDANGDLLIPDTYTLPLTMFCRWMWSLRKNDNRSEIDQNYGFWVRERDKVRGRMKMPSQLEANAIAAAWINLFNSSRIRAYF